MIESIKNIDVQLLLAINGLHFPVMDDVMLFFSNKYTWIPFYALIIAFIIWIKRREAVWIIIAIVLSVICADLFASSFMKPFFQRLRPCHDETIQSSLYLVGDLCGGKFGFVSSHAANTFALATFLFLLFRIEYRWISLVFLWASLVSISRVYLGVHYPTDVIVGALVGMVMAGIFIRIWHYLRLRLL